jgi:hypothetical protein
MMMLRMQILNRRINMIIHRLCQIPQEKTRETRQSPERHRDDVYGAEPVSEGLF